MAHDDGYRDAAECRRRFYFTRSRGAGAMRYAQGRQNVEAGVAHDRRSSRRYPAFRRRVIARYYRRDRLPPNATTLRPASSNASSQRRQDGDCRCHY